MPPFITITPFLSPFFEHLAQTEMSFSYNFITFNLILVQLFNSVIEKNHGDILVSAQVKRILTVNNVLWCNETLVIRTDLQPCYIEATRHVIYFTFIITFVIYFHHV